MRKYRSALLFLVALTLSALAGFGAVKYLEQREKQLMAELDSEADYVKVIVAKRNLVVGDEISADTVSLRPIPSAYIPDGAIYPSDFDHIGGMATSKPISAGKPVLRDYLEGLSGVERFSHLLKPGQRAVTLKVNEVDSNENMLGTGDYVDLLVMYSPKGTDNEKVFVSPVLERVHVLATGRKTVSDPKFYQADPYGGYATITVGVDSKEVKKIIAARDAGTVYYALRNPKDSTKGRYGPPINFLADGNQDRHISVLSGGKADNGVLHERSGAIEGLPNNRWNESSEGRLYKKYRVNEPIEDGEREELASS